MRSVLDLVDPKLLQPFFRAATRQLQQGKALAQQNQSMKKRRKSRDARFCVSTLAIIIPTFFALSGGVG